MRTVLAVVVCLSLGFALQGCIPLPQIETKPSQVAFHVNYNFGEDHVLFAAGNENRAKPYEIVAARSWATDPSGRRHPIRLKPHQYDLSEHFAFVRDEVFVLRSEADEHPVGLRDGTWSFRLAMRRGGDVRQEVYSFRIWRFYYNPLIHGPPN